MTTPVIADMFTLISCQEHIAPTQSYVEQRCLALDPSNPHYTTLLAPNLQLRIEQHDFEHHTAYWLWLQLYPISQTPCYEGARGGV